MSSTCLPISDVVVGSLLCSGPGQGARTAFEDAHQLMLALKAHWPDRQAVAQQYEVRQCAKNMYPAHACCRAWLSWMEVLHGPGLLVFTATCAGLTDCTQWQGVCGFHTCDAHGLLLIKALVNWQLSLAEQVFMS